MPNVDTKEQIIFKAEKLIVSLLFIFSNVVFFTGARDYYTRPRELYITILVVFLFLLLTFKKRAIIFSKKNILFLALLLIGITYNIITATYTGGAISGSIRLLTIIFIFFYLTNSNFTFSDYSKWISYGAAIPILVGCKEALTKPPEVALNFVNGLTGNKNQLAIYLVICLPSFVYMTFKGGKDWLKLLGWTEIITSLILITLLQSKNAYLALTLIGLLAWIVLLIKHKKLVKKAASLTFGALTLMIITAWLTSSMGKSTNETLTFSEKSNNRIGMSAQSRIDLWTTTANMILENPLGVGAYNWEVDIYKYGLYEKSDQAELFFTMPHNDLVLVSSEFGLPLTLLLLGSIIVLSWKMYQQGSPEDLLILMGALAFLFTSNFSSPFSRINLLLLFITYLSCANSERKENRFVKLPISTLLIFPLLFAYITATHLYGEVQLKKARTLSRKHQYEKAAEACELAYDYFYKIGNFSTPVKHFAAMHYLDAGDTTRFITASKQAIQDHPYYVHTYNNIASYYVTKKKLDSAIAWYEKALKLYPEFNETILNLTVTYIKKGDCTKARETLSTITDPEVNPMFEELLHIIVTYCEFESLEPLKNKPKLYLRKQYFDSLTNQSNLLKD